MEERNELPSGKELIRPHAGFTVKCKNTKIHEKGASKTRGKLFLNIVYSERVSKPMPITEKCRQSQENSPNAAGTNWSVPFALGPLRMEADKSGKHLVPTFDCCFHPLSLQYAHGSKAFRDLVVHIAKDAVMRLFEASGDATELESGYTILKGISYKNGTPKALMVPMVLSNAPDDSSSNMRSGGRIKCAETRCVGREKRLTTSNT